MARAGNRFTRRVGDDTRDERHPAVQLLGTNLDEAPKLLGGKRMAFARTASNAEAMHALFQQELHLMAEGLFIHVAVLIEGCGERRNDACDFCQHVRPSFLCIVANKPGAALYFTSLR
jgi:hypothetical protein